MSYSVALIRKIDSVAPELKETLLLLLEKIEQQREASVTRTEFGELKNIVRELAEAQKRTEQRVEELAKALLEQARRGSWWCRVLSGVKRFAGRRSRGIVRNPDRGLSGFLTPRIASEMTGLNRYERIN